MEFSEGGSVSGESTGSIELPDPAHLSGVKVMVIDDSNTIRRSAEIFLLQAGCTVILAEDGFDALAKITDHQPDLIFVDIMMPRLDGYQTCALIKKNTRFHHDAGGHAVVEGRLVRPGARPHGRVRSVSDQAVHQGKSAQGGRNACEGRGALMPRRATGTPGARREGWERMTIKRVLIVDDSPTERHVLNDMLTKAGYEVVASDNGEDAILKAKTTKPDLILMDVVMPGLNGFQATRAISRDPADAPVPIILCTSKSQETDKIWGMRQGARDYIVKPVRPRGTAREDHRAGLTRFDHGPCRQARPARVPAGARDTPGGQDHGAGRAVAPGSRMCRRAMADPTRRRGRSDRRAVGRDGADDAALVSGHRQHSRQSLRRASISPAFSATRRDARAGRERFALDPFRAARRRVACRPGGSSRARTAQSRGAQAHGRAGWSAVVVRLPLDRSPTAGYGRRSILRCWRRIRRSCRWALVRTPRQTR